MKMVPLGELMLDRNEALNPAAFPEETFELYSIPAHDRGGAETRLGATIGSAKQLVRPGDVMLSRIVPHIRRSRVVPLAQANRQIASGEWIVFRHEMIHPEFLAHMLTSDEFHAHFMATVAGVGGSLNRARPQHVKTIRVPLPEIAEQRRIAAILDQADALRTHRRALICELDALVGSLFETANRTTRQAETTTIGRLALSTQYGSAERASTAGTTPILRMGNITDGGRIDTSDLKYLSGSSEEYGAYMTQRGDLLFNRTNSVDKVGKAAVVRLDAAYAFAGYLIRVRFDSAAIAEWVSAYLRSAAGHAVRRRVAKAAVNQANINATEMKQFVIRVPGEQILERFAREVAEIEMLRAGHLRALTALDELFASLQSRAFRGEL